MRRSKLRRFVLTDGPGDSGPGRAVKDAGLDDLAFIESDVKMLIRRSHKRYLRSKRGIQVWTKIMIRAGRVNATCSSWRLNAISARLELRLLFHFSKIAISCKFYCILEEKMIYIMTQHCGVEKWIIQRLAFLITAFGNC